jgi:hypothetical protein
MCLNAVCDSDNNFFVEPAWVTAYVDVLILIRLEYCYQLVTCIHFIFATFSAFIDDLKIKQFISS